MRFLTVLLFLIQVTVAWSVENNLEKNVDQHIRVLTATNNVGVYLYNARSKFSPEFYTEVKGMVGKDKIYQARRLSKTAFSVKFSGERWVRFEFDVKNNQFLVGKAPFLWSVKKNMQQNFDDFYALVNKEYPLQQEESAWWQIFPKAHAQSLANDLAQVIVSGSTAASAAPLGFEAFMTRVERHCEGHPLAHLHASYFESDNRRNLVRDFRSARDFVNSRSFANIFGLMPNKNMIGRFHEAQNCLRERRYIGTDDLLPIQYNSNSGTGTVISQ